MTKTAVIVLLEVILIVPIPPLLPQPPDFFGQNFTRIPPLFTISFPDGMALLPPDHTHIIWTMVSSWYFGSPHPFYFDMLCQDYKRRRFQITLKPDLSTASLHAINSSECLPPNNSSTLFRGSTYCQHSRICEDTLVSFWRYDEHYCGLYTGLTSDRFSNVISRCGPAAQMLLPNFGCEYILYPCPASGRFVRLDARNGVAVLDFF